MTSTRGLAYSMLQQSGFRRASVTGAVALVLAGCAGMPTGPSVGVMPAANKPFDVFVQEDQLCRGWAAHSIGLAGHDAAAEAALTSTLAGAAIGALAGAATGGHRHDVQAGAALGAAIGATAGASRSNATAWNAQRRYDLAYQQCMYSKGNLVPLPGYGSHHYQTLPPVTIPPPPAPQR